MFNIGDKVIILKSSHIDFIGKTGIVIHKDIINGVKVKILFNDWSGYYPESYLANTALYVVPPDTTSNE